MPKLRVSLAQTREKVTQGAAPLAGLTAYSFPQALALEEAGVDWILIGDSGGMVELGLTNTRPVSLTNMLSMAEAVRRGAPQTYIVGDLPFGSYEESPQQAVSSAIALAKAGDVDAVKLEGGARVVRQVEAITSAGMVVMGHLGLTPQGVSSASPYRVFGRSALEVRELISDAVALKEAGVSAILLEALPPEVTRLVVDAVDVTFLGIGSGRPTHGQLLILHDIVGLYPRFRPTFARNFARDVLSDPAENDALVSSDNPLIDLMKRAARRYVEAVRQGSFPADENSYAISSDDLAAVMRELSRPESQVTADGGSPESKSSKG